MCIRDSVRSQRNSPTTVGQIAIHVDRSKLETENFFSLLTEPNRDIFFSFVEKIYMSEGVSLEELESDLRTDPTFGLIYTQGSLRLGTTIVDTQIPETNVGPATVVDRIDFELVFPEVTEKFRLWINREVFIDSYPLTTITKVILPCDYSLLLQPSLINNTVDALIASTSFSFGSMSNSVAQGDNSGLLTYNTRYKVNSQSIKMMPFGILYKGATPSSLEIRKAIRELLLSFGVATADTWKAILPDLFVTGQFFLIPMWNDYITRPERKVYQSILRMKNTEGVISTLYPAMSVEFIRQHQQIFTYAKNPGFALVIPDPLNETQFSLVDIHPTYQHYSTQSSESNFMEEHTREFAINLNRVISSLMGEGITEGYITNIFDEKRYLSFVAADIEYHVLYPESYPETNP